MRLEKVAYGSGRRLVSTRSTAAMFTLHRQLCAPSSNPRERIQRSRRENVVKITFIMYLLELLRLPARLVLVVRATIASKRGHMRSGRDVSAQV